MPQVDWEQIQGLLEQALLLPIHERAAWLERLPAAQDSLKEPLRRLLEVQAGLQTRPFLDGSSTGKDGLTPPATVLIGDLVGPYRLLQQIGDGGMGSVWLAERADGTLKRKVALKLPRMVWARDLATRMARERDILSSLEHPNIARLYDAGVDQLGRPFLALEYVEGHRIDQYCDAERLSIRERIRLFLQVLDAVQYAHTNLVLHRDLKPGNVLVNQRGEVRLLDFGIAKLLGDETGAQHPDPQSRSMSRAMTPRYASPEQVRQQRLALPSDVYSLGVMLYELLVGASPLIAGNGSRAELEIAIMEGQLRTPSRAKADESVAERRQTTAKRMSRAMRGELDAVLMKALAKSPADRYPTAEALRSDLVRWLDGHPVRAKPPSRILMIKKFVARNAWSVGLGSAAVSAIIATALVALYQAREARLESQRAAATRDFLLGLFENANPELHGGRELTARDLLGKGEDLLSQNVEMDLRARADLYAGIANIWNVFGNAEKTLSASIKRIELLRPLGPSTRFLRASLDLAEAGVQSDRTEVVEQATREVQILSKKIALSESHLSEYYWYIGWINLKKSHWANAESWFTNAYEIAREIGNADAQLRALSGRMQARAGLNKRSTAIKDYKDSSAIIEVSTIDIAQIVSRKLELAASLFVLSEHDLGWALTEELKRTSDSQFGEFTESQAKLHILWLVWSKKIGKFQSAIDWIERRKVSISNDKDRPFRSADLDFMIIEADILMSANKKPDAHKILDALQSRGDLLSNAQKLSASSINIKALLGDGMYQEAMSELNSPLWDLDRYNKNFRKEWGYSKPYLTGLALMMSGEFAQARVIIESSVRLAKSSLGAEHPQVEQMLFNLRVIRVLEKIANRNDASAEMTDIRGAKRRYSANWTGSTLEKEKVASIVDDLETMRRTQYVRSPGALVIL